MAPLPPGFSTRPIECGWAVLRDDLADALLAAGVATPHVLTPAAWVQGRRPHPVVELADARRVVVRECAHGGLWGRIAGCSFWGASRALQELAVAAGARERGAPVPEVVGVVAKPLALGLCRLFVLSMHVPDALDLRDLLERGPRLSARQRHGIARAAGRSVAGCHAAGLHHADLHVKNVLVQSLRGAEPAVHVIDLDKAALRDALSPRQRRASLSRLNRSIEKWPALRRAVSERDKLAFWKAYVDALPAAKPSESRACATVPWVHRLAWAWSPKHER